VSDVDRGELVGGHVLGQPVAKWFDREHQCRALPAAGRGCREPIGRVRCGPVRELAGRTGLSERAWRKLVRVAYAKVAEFQARGLVHFHVIMRLDGAQDRAMAPGVSVTPGELCDAIREAAGRSSLTGDAGDGTVELRFGEQLHTRILPGARDGDGELSPEQVAAYVAKYACKASHEQITSRDIDLEKWRDRGVPEQLVQMAAAAIGLSQRSGLRGIGAWVHMLGFRGHFITKSRGYSTKLGTLRAERAAYRAKQDQPDNNEDEDESTPVLGFWRYLGSGYLNPGDVLLAAGVEASLRAAREALLDVRRCARPSVFGAVRSGYTDPVPDRGERYDGGEGSPRGQRDPGRERRGDQAGGPGQPAARRW
jgi:hypothetical protein